MHILKSVQIDLPADDVWTIIGPEFDEAYKWMGPVKHSYSITEDGAHDDAPMSGRVCELSNKKGGLQAHELITYYSDQARTLTMIVTPQNNSLIPVKYNEVSIQVMPVSDERCEVIWASTPKLKPMGKVLAPLLFMGFNKAFGDLLRQLKIYAESGKTVLAV